MNKNIILGVSLLMAVPCIASTHLTPEQALEAALNAQPLKVAKVRGLDNFKLAFVPENKAAYAFNHTDGEGFTIVSAYAESKCPVLGYSDTGYIDAENIPDGLKWFMETVGEQPPVLRSPEASVLEDIEPLVTAHWTQDTPFNNLCPIQNAQNTYVGCMATAIAQVLYHPSNRPQPIGSYTYAWPSTGTELSFDYDANPFDYSLMLEDYSGGYTSEQAQAAASLCYGVGVACNMNYGWMQSGCSQYDAADAMRLRLGVDNGIGLVFRDFYEAHEWAELIHKRLMEDCPVIYIGVSTVGGHAFIADGYQGESGDYFHINWGWGGMSDGYFLLSALLPEQLGIGGGSNHDGFNSNQMAFLDIRPAREGSKPAPTLYMTGVFCGEFTDETEEVMAFSCQHGLSAGAGMFSYALDTIYGALGLKLKDTATDEDIYVGESEELEFLVYHGYLAFSVPSEFFPENGDYIVSPVFIRDGIHYDIVQDIETRNELHLVCENGKRSFNSVDISHRVVAENLQLEGDEIVRSKDFSIKVDLRAQHVDYSGSVFPALLDRDGYVAAKMSRQMVDLKDGDSVTLEWNERFAPVLAEGEYLFTLLNAEELVLYELMPINVVKTAGIDNIDQEEGECEYYNIQGLKVTSGDKPAGIYLQKSAKGTKKILVK